MMCRLNPEVQKAMTAITCSEPGNAPQIHPRRNKLATPLRVAGPGAASQISGDVPGRPVLPL